MLNNNMWMINAYHSTSQAFRRLHDVVVPDDRRGLPAAWDHQVRRQSQSRVEHRPQRPSVRHSRPGLMPLPPPPPPPPQGPSELPSLLGRRGPPYGYAPMNYWDSDPFKTRLPGEMTR
eukprot:g33163.t1